MTIVQDEIRGAVARLGLSGGIVCLHTSLKSFGRVEGGAGAVVGAFLDEGCTVVAPTFYYGAIVRPPEGRMPERNGCDYSRLPEAGSSQIAPYTGAGDQIDESMGAVPAFVLRMEDSVRGNHPFNSFAAVGPLARQIVRGQAPLDVYAPFREMYGRDRAFIVLAGVGLTRATAIHFAEQLAGRRLFRAWAKVAGDGIQETEVGSCSEGFENLAAFVSEIETSASVGRSPWRIFPFRDFVDRIARAVKENPRLTHCGNDNCLRCRDAVAGGPITSA
ncbi:MAG: AAC(3) family N-acetyltransferase [Patescibacteria group bacterium]